MNGFVPSKLTAKRIAFGLFVLTLFCDAANLDDLVTSSPVLHDDLNLPSPILSSSEQGFAVGSAEYMQSSLHQVTHHVYKAQQIIRLVIDQDSPAIAADGARAAFDLLALLSDVSIRLPESEIPTSLLHIRHHSLLI